MKFVVHVACLYRLQFMSSIAVPTTHTKHFYNKNHLSTMLSNNAHRSIISASHRRLCETSTPNKLTQLLATDELNTTIFAHSARTFPVIFSPYGHDTLTAANILCTRFTGQCRLSTIGYLLGNGHRLFNPVLMRFHSADQLSPFSKGGINCYAYCGNDPVNRHDPTGKTFSFKEGLWSKKYSFNTLSRKLKTKDPFFSPKEYKALEKSFAKPKRSSAIELDELSAKFHALQKKEGPKSGYSISKQDLSPSLRDNISLSSSTGAAESPAVEAPQFRPMKSTILPFRSNDPIIFDTQDSHWTLQNKSRLVRTNLILAQQFPEFT